MPAFVCDKVSRSSLGMFSNKGALTPTNLVSLHTTTPILLMFGFGFFV